MAFKTLPLGRVFIAKGRQTAGGVTLEALGVEPQAGMDLVVGNVLRSVLRQKEQGAQDHHYRSGESEVAFQCFAPSGLAHFSANRMWVSGSQVLIFP
jgi:hypothetical protein